MGTGKNILLVAGEVSGDIYGSLLVRYLVDAGVNVYAVGGERIKKSGANLIYDSTGWSSIGYVESLKKLPYLYWVYLRLCKIIPDMDLLLLIDFPGFNMQLARYAKKVGVPTLYYFPPSKFASSSRDVEDAAATITKICATFKNTYEIYKKAGADVEFVGHPVVEVVKLRFSSEDEFRKYLNIDSEYIVGIFPGTRVAEINLILPELLNFAISLKKEVGDVSFVIPTPSNLEALYETMGWNSMIDRIKDKYGINILKVKDIAFDVMKWSYCCVVTSGTATLEASYLGCPMVVVYKVSLFTELVAKFFNKIPRFISIPNILMGRQIVPELVQRDMNYLKIKDEVLKFFSDKNYYSRVREDLLKIKDFINGTSPSKRVFEIALNFLR